VMRKTASTAHPCSSCKRKIDIIATTSNATLSAAPAGPARKRKRKTAARTAATSAATRMIRYPVCGGIAAADRRESPPVAAR